MSRFEDLRAALEEQIARERAALEFVAQLERFIAAREDDGFGVVIDRPLMSDCRLHVNMEVLCPAGTVSAPALEIVEPLAQADVASMQEAICAPGKISRVTEDTVAPEVPDHAPAGEVATPEVVKAPAKPAPNPNGKSGTAWSEDEDQQLIGMIARGLTAREAADRLGRPYPGTQYRCRKILKERISAAKIAAARGRKAEASVSHPVPERCGDPEPVLAEKLAVAPAPAPAPEVGARPMRSPIEGFHAADISPQQLRAHFGWLYAGTPDPDILALDLQLVEMICRGDGAGAVAAEFDWSKEQVLERWSALRGGVETTLRLQEMMLKLLHEMAQGAAA